MFSDFLVKTDYEGIDFEEVNAILSFYGLTNVSTALQEKIFRNSYAVAFILKDGHVIGVGRAISDGISQAAIYNIAVKDDYRGNGLGKVIVDSILEQVEGCNVILYTHPKHIGLYEHWGFSRLKTGYIKFYEEEHYREAGFID